MNLARSTLALVSGLSGCYLIDYSAPAVVDAGSTIDGSVIIEPHEDSAVDTEASAVDAQVGPSLRDAAQWWIDAAVSRTCTAPTCELMCSGDSCVMDCAGQAQCKTHCMGMSRCYSECAGSLDCQLKCDAMSDCTFDCSDSPLASCTTKCDADTSCFIDCSGVASCTVKCDRGASCEIDCRKSASCGPFTCDKEASCLAYCGNNVACSIECDGTPMSCPGGIATCNRLCP